MTRSMSERTESAVDSITAPDTAELDAESARDYNITAVRSVSELVRTTLGPCGKEKMIEQPDGSVLITGDAVTILEEVAIEEPAAALLVGAADAVGRARHDGTTTAIVFGAALVAEAEALFDQGLHPSAVIRGYERAEAIARAELESVSQPIDVDRSVLTDIARTTMSGAKITDSRGLSELAELVVSAVELVRRGDTADPSHVRVVTQAGRSTAASEVVDGVVLRDEPVRQAMPSSVEDATVLLTRDSVQLKDTGMDATVSFEDGASFDRFVDQEADEIYAMIDSMLEMGVNAVLCSASIADRAQSVLSVNEVLGVRRVDEEALQAAAAVLGGRVVANVTDATAADFGTGRITRDENDELFTIEGDGDQRATILLCGPSHQLLAERERHVLGAVDAVANNIDEPLVAGGGATEVEIARRVRESAPRISGREQVAVEAFADALEDVVRVLATNAGQDPLETLLELRRIHADGGHRTGIDAEGTLRDLFDAGVVERVGTKRQVIESATAAASAVLGVDDVFFVGELTDDE
jgi:chaperonin GroEL (HSP60 family)